jgi:hypothetical protein
VARRGDRQAARGRARGGLRRRCRAARETRGGVNTPSAFLRTTPPHHRRQAASQTWHRAPRCRAARETRGGVNTPSEASRNLYVVDALQPSRALTHDPIPPHAADSRRIPPAVAKKRRRSRSRGAHRAFISWRCDRVCRRRAPAPLTAGLAEGWPEGPMPTRLAGGSAGRAHNRPGWLRIGRQGPGPQPARLAVGRPANGGATHGVVMGPSRARGDQYHRSDRMCAAGVLHQRSARLDSASGPFTHELAMLSRRRARDAVGLPSRSRASQVAQPDRLRDGLIRVSGGWEDRDSSRHSGIE